MMRLYLPTVGTPAETFARRRRFKNAKLHTKYVQYNNDGITF